MNNNYIYRQDSSINSNPGPINMKGFNQESGTRAPDIYIDDDFFINLGHSGEFHMSFPDSIAERDKIFSGIIVEATADHLIIHNKETNEWYLLPLLYLNYAVTNEKPIIPHLLIT